MLIVTDVNTYNQLQFYISNYRIYNVSSMSMNYTKLDVYPTPQFVYQTVQLQNAVDANDRIYNMDQMYADMLMNDVNMFTSLMQIVRDLYYGFNVILLVYREEKVFDGLTESLCKFIQQRYGYNYQLVNTVDDYNSRDDSSFSVGGIMNFDIDNKRYLEILAQVQPKTFMDENIAAKNGWII